VKVLQSFDEPFISNFESKFEIVKTAMTGLNSDLCFPYFLPHIFGCPAHLTLPLYVENWVFELENRLVTSKPCPFDPFLSYHQAYGIRAPT